MLWAGHEALPLLLGVDGGEFMPDLADDERRLLSVKLIIARLIVFAWPPA